MLHPRRRKCRYYNDASVYEDGKGDRLMVEELVIGCIYTFRMTFSGNARQTYACVDLEVELISIDDIPDHPDSSVKSFCIFWYPHSDARRERVALPIEDGIAFGENDRGVRTEMGYFVGTGELEDELGRLVTAINASCELQTIGT